MTDKRAELLKSGKELFSKNGFKGTNVAKITKGAGMATGTFYNYYDSKDKLFLDIFLEENIKLKKSILKTMDLDKEPMVVLEEMIAKNINGIKSNPILREWYNKDVYNRIEKLYRQEKGTAHIDFVFDCFIDVIKQWQDDGKMRKDIDAQMIMAIFSAIINIDTHKEEIGIQYFPQLQEYIGTFVMKGLMDTY